MTSKLIRKTELARDLAVSPALVSKWLDRGLLRDRRDGLLDRREVIERLHLFWCPAKTWWQKRVGPVGRALRQLWLREQLEYEKAKRKEGACC